MPAEDLPEDDSDAEVGATEDGEAKMSTDGTGDVDGVENREDETDTEDEGESDPASISTIERIVLDTDDVIRAIAYNGQEDVGRKGKAVFSLTPPFGETVRPTIKHLDDDSTESKTDGEIHLRPFRFVVDGRGVVEQRPTRRLAIEELDAEDPTEKTIDTWLDEAMETWTDHVRENLAESVDIFSPHGMAIVAVEYETTD